MRSSRTSDNKQIKEINVKKASKKLDIAMTTFPPDSARTIELMIQLFDCVIDLRDEDYYLELTEFMKERVRKMVMLRGGKKKRAGGR
jgi:hypothetical protein